MIKIISGKKYRKLNEELDGLRIQNSESHKSLTQLEGYAQSLKEELSIKRAEVQSRDVRIERLKESESKLKNDISLLDENIKEFRIETRDFKHKNTLDVKRIEELETELKLAKSKSNTLAENLLIEKRAIQNYKNDTALLNEEIAGKNNLIAELKEKVEICKSKPTPTQPTTEIPNTLEAVELGAVAPLEAEVVPTAVEAVKSLGAAIANAGQTLGNVKRRYQKTGKFKKRK